MKKFFDLFSDLIQFKKGEYYRLVPEIIKKTPEVLYHTEFNLCILPSFNYLIVDTDSMLVIHDVRWDKLSATIFYRGIARIEELDKEQIMDWVIKGMIQKMDDFDLRSFEFGLI